MRPYTILGAICAFLYRTNGVDMSQYAAGPGVEVEFRGYLRELYASVEDHLACFDFIDFFQNPESLIIVDRAAQGALAVLSMKAILIPPLGNKHWNHLPNVTAVYAESKLRKVYEVQGVIETVFEGGNCSAAYYKTLLPIVKGNDGTTQLQPHGRNLLAYNDFFVEPMYTPTDIACGEYRPPAVGSGIQDPD